MPQGIISETMREAEDDVERSWNRSCRNKGIRRQRCSRRWRRPLRVESRVREPAPSEIRRGQYAGPDDAFEVVPRGEEGEIWLRTAVTDKDVALVPLVPTSRMDDRPRIDEGQQMLEDELLDMFCVGSCGENESLDRKGWAKAGSSQTVGFELGRVVLHDPRTRDGTLSLFEADNRFAPLVAVFGKLDLERLYATEERNGRAESSRRRKVRLRWGRWWLVSIHAAAARDDKRQERTLGRKLWY